MDKSNVRSNPKSLGVKSPTAHSRDSTKSKFEQYSYEKLLVQFIVVTL